MIVKLDKDTATTENIGGNTFFYNEYGFFFCPHRRKKVKFMEIEYNKDLDFLDTLALRVRPMWDALHWYKKQ